MFFDMDGDNDQDVLFVETYNSKLFKNNGSGLFTEVAATAFQVEASPALAIADVDGDNDLDILITSFSFIDDVGLAKLYTNDGTGVFLEVLGTPFQGVVSGSIAFADIDGDNDPDVLISGGADLFGNSPIVKLYTNDGAGVFSEVLGTPFQGVEFSSIAFADVDGDSDQDVLISGASPSAVISKLYSNDGSGIFTEVSGTPFLQSLGWAIAFVDVDGDDDPDAIITGDTGSTFIFSKVYRNQTAPADNECSGATDINSLFGGVVNTPMTSSLFNHTGYTSEGTDPTSGFDCHYQGDPLQNTMWFSFDGDGNTYRIRTVDCSATNPHTDTQAALYSGDCNTLTPVLCNDDEDVNNNLLNVQLDIETVQGTTYYMLVDGYDGEEGEFCLEVTRTDPNNIFEAEYQTVNVYPNPTEGVVSWNGITARTAEVMDNTGRMVMNIAQPNGTVDISNLKDGIYIMMLHTEEGVYTSRVVKQ